jgi:hypothetical protein
MNIGVCADHKTIHAMWITQKFVSQFVELYFIFYAFDKF